MRDETGEQGRELRDLLKKWMGGNLHDLVPRLLNGTVLAVAATLVILVTWVSRMPAPIMSTATESKTDEAQVVTLPETPPAETAQTQSPAPQGAPIEPRSAPAAAPAISEDVSPTVAASPASPMSPGPATKAQPAAPTVAPTAETPPKVAAKPVPRLRKGRGTGLPRPAAAEQIRPTLPELLGSIPFNDGGPMDLDNETARLNYQKRNVTGRR